MKIWWCQEHDRQEAGEGLCWPIMVYGAEYPPSKHCRMVPMRLIPDNAANLIHGVLRMWNPDINDYAIQKCAVEVIAALDGETP